MKQRINIFLLSHGELGEHLFKSAELIIGKIDDIYAFSLKKEMSIKDLINLVENKIIEINGQVILLTDMFGGTPSNVAMYLKQKYTCEVVSGMNLPLLLDLVISRDNSEKGLEELLDDCVSSGRNAIKRHEMINSTDED